MKTAICSMIKDEHLYLKEWIDWHLNLGFDAIHLFEDKGSKSHEDIVKDYDNVYLRRYEDDKELQELFLQNGKTIKQDILHRYFIEEYKGIYDWAAFIDNDEYITFDDLYNLNKLCKEFNDYPAIHLSWKMMGASGHIKRPKDGIVKSYTKECDYPEDEVKIWWVKSIINLKKCKGINSLHHACGGVNIYFEESDGDILFKKAWINHYFTKSWEDWCYRIFKRGDTLNGHRQLCHFFNVNKDMMHLKEKLVASVKMLKPVNTYFIDSKKGFISGGNINKLKELNNKT